MSGARNLAALKKGLEVDEVLAISAKTDYGVKELWKQIEGVAKKDSSRLRNPYTGSCHAKSRGLSSTIYTGGMGRC